MHPNHAENGIRFYRKTFLQYILFWRIFMNYFQILLEHREQLKEEHKLSFYLQDCDTEIFYAFNTKGDMIATGTEWAYITDEGNLISKFYSDGSERETLPSNRQQMEMLYLIPEKITLEEYKKNPLLMKDKIPLPMNYEVKQITCQNEIFTISSKKENPDIIGSFLTMLQQLVSIEYSYYGKHGLTSNVLNRYYYEFLVESHELYLREEERKNPKKDSTTLKNIETKDFQEKDGDYKCECEHFFWGVRSNLYIDYCPDKEKNNLDKFVKQLNLHFLWIQQHKKEILQAVLDNGMVELANYWMEGMEIEDEDGCLWYELYEGGQIPCPITEKTFLEALYLGGILVYGSDEDEITFDVFLSTDPDFFACHDIEVFITAIPEENTSLSEQSFHYEIKVNGLAG